MRGYIQIYEILDLLNHITIFRQNAYTKGRGVSKAKFVLSSLTEEKMEGNNDRPWFSTPANPAPPVLNLSGISTVANKELEEGELSQTSNSHQLSHFSNLSRVESSKAVFRGQTEDSYERDGSAVEETNSRSLRGWAGNREISGASSKSFCKSSLLGKT